ncbi:MAG: hypothetical protein QM653_14955 [Dysgonomonas sp.]|uniref:hypothetical protein n=1 Tax=Dysgonomonas sp. TaxID=1891233 RepID=UPI0039E3A293
MGKLQQIINELKSLDLKTCSTEDITSVLLRIGKIPAPIRDIHKDHVIYRASSLQGKETIKNSSRLSYCPASKNKSFQRASTPMQTMFYGVLGDVDDKLFDLNGEMLALQEACSFFKYAPAEDGVYRVAVSKWRVVNTISLLTLMQPETTNKSKRLNDMVSGLLDFIKENKDSFEEEDAIAFHKFMCNEFTKPVENENEYRISALFTNEIIKNTDGTVWQSSVAIDEKLNDTLCVAVKPETVNKSMVCLGYAIYTIIIKDGKLSYSKENFSVKATKRHKKRKKHKAKRKKIIKKRKVGKSIITKRRVRKRKKLKE